MILYRVGLDHDEKTSRPGAAISILPDGENADGERFGSTEATDMTVGELAGEPTPGPALLDPAIIRQPLLSAACPAAVKTGTGPGDGEPARGNKITGHLLAMAQFMPARMLVIVPAPELDSTLPTKIDDRKAIP